MYCSIENINTRDQCFSRVHVSFGIKFQKGTAKIDLLRGKWSKILHYQHQQFGLIVYIQKITQIKAHSLQILLIISKPPYP